MHVSLLPHFVFIDSVYSALSTSSLLIFRQTYRQNTFKLNNTEKRARNVFDVVAAIVKKIVLQFNYCASGGNHSKPEFLEGLCSEKIASARSQSLGMVFV